MVLGGKYLTLTMRGHQQPTITSEVDGGKLRRYCLTDKGKTVMFFITEDVDNRKNLIKE